MPKSLKLYVAGLVTLSAVALVVTSLVLSRELGWILGIGPGISIVPGSDSPSAVLGGLTFWVLITLFASAMPVRMPRGSIVSVSIAPIVASMVLGGPAAAGWVAALGTTEVREIRGRVPWYGTLFNHAGLTVPAILGGFVYLLLAGDAPQPIVSFGAAMIAAAIFHFTNVAITALGVALRDDLDFRVVALGDTRSYLANLFALAPLAWLMARIYTLPQGIGWWAVLLFAVPLYTTRLAYSGSWKSARCSPRPCAAWRRRWTSATPFTSGHSHRVQDDRHGHRPGDEGQRRGAGGPGVGRPPPRHRQDRRAGLGAAQAGAAHARRADAHERAPGAGRGDHRPGRAARPELPIIRHHHEWFNGSGYPDRLVGDEIPRLARILHVADAFEAMTAARPYRMTPLTAEQALAELRKFGGIQFDPDVVDAFVKTSWASGVEDAGQGPPVQIAPRPLPLLGEAAARMSPLASDPQTQSPTS